MRFVSVRDLRGKSAQVWRRLAVERDMIVTSNGKPIAILTKTDERTFEESLTAIRRSRAMEALASMQMRSAARGLDRLTLDEINAEIAAVRRVRAGK